jgi:replicative DNA helicase
MSNTETKLLSTLRNPQYQHFVSSMSPNMFTGDRVTYLAAYQMAYEKYGALSAEAIESILGASLPPEFDIPVSVDPVPLIHDLQRLARKRNLQEMAQELLDESKKYDPDVELLRSKLEAKDDFVTHDASLVPGISQFIANLKAKETREYKWLNTGIPFLDAMVGNEWPRGEISIITARSGGGKSAFMGSSALNMARIHKDSGESSPVAIFSMEMPKDQLIARFVTDMTGIDGRVIRTGRYVDGKPLSDEDRISIDNALEELQTLPLYIVDAERLSAQEIIRTARALMIDKGVQVFFIDYLQLMSYDNEMGKHYGLGDGVKQLKAFVKRYKVAVVILAQYHETKETIRDATDPEKDCALWVHLSIDFDERDDQGVCPATVEVRKSRHGPVGKATVLYNARRLSFLAKDMP